MTYAAMATPPSRRAEMWYAGTGRQHRATVGFRIILAIPQFVILGFLFLAMLFVAIIGWFAALVMGRLPDWAHSFISGVIRWNVRVSAYVFLLTDRYPPFSLDDEDYPARPFPPESGRLNRWAVLFRFILFIPASVFAQIVQYGLVFPLLIVTWFIVLISGEMPPPLYGPYSALLRYQLRVQSYFFMLTSEYPWGMLGDREVAAPPFPEAPFGAPAAPFPPFPPAAPPSPSPTGMPGSLPPPPPPQPYSYPSGQAPAPTPPQPSSEPEMPSPDVPPSAPPSDAGGQPPGWPPPAPPPPPPSGFVAMPAPTPWERAAPPPGQGPAWAKLVLTGAARGWMIFAIVWGSILFVAQESIQQATINNNNTNNNNPYPIDLHAPATHHVPFV